MNFSGHGYNQNRKNAYESQKNEFEAEKVNKTSQENIGYDIPPNEKNLRTKKCGLSFQDNDTLIITALIYVLMREKADMKIIAALVYLLM